MNQLVAKRTFKVEGDYDYEFYFWWLTDDGELCISLGGNDKLDEITIDLDDLKKELKKRGKL